MTLVAMSSIAVDLTAFLEGFTLVQLDKLMIKFGKLYIYSVYALLVPESEKYILRSCQTFFKSSQMQEDLKLCFAQEGNHSVVHGQFSRLFQKLDYDLRMFLDLYRWISYDIPEKYLSRHFNLTGAAASEQLNTAISLASLDLENFNCGQGETLEMLKWHFLEEIEHREVVFNLMRENKIGIFLRSYVMFNFFLGFCFWLPFGAFLLGFQDGNLWKISFWYQAFIHNCRMNFFFLKASVNFCLPNYNPKNESLPDTYQKLLQEYS